MSGEDVNNQASAESEELDESIRLELFKKNLEEREMYINLLRRVMQSEHGNADPSGMNQLREMETELKIDKEEFIRDKQKFDAEVALEKENAQLRAQIAQFAEYLSKKKKKEKLEEQRRLLIEEELEFQKQQAHQDEQKRRKEYFNSFLAIIFKDTELDPRLKSEELLEKLQDVGVTMKFYRDSSSFDVLPDDFLGKKCIFTNKKTHKKHLTELKALGKEQKSLVVKLSLLEDIANRKPFQMERYLFKSTSEDALGTIQKSSYPLEYFFFQKIAL